MKKTKYKVGEKVKVREDLKGGEVYNDVFFSPAMERYRGKEFIIKDVLIRKFGYAYKLNLSEQSNWTFAHDMLEYIKFPQKTLPMEQTAKFKIYVEEIIINDPATIMFYRSPIHDNKTGEFLRWSDVKKVVSKANKEVGDDFDLSKGINVALLKAYRKEIDRALKKY